MERRCHDSTVTIHSQAAVRRVGGTALPVAAAQLQGGRLKPSGRQNIPLHLNGHVASQQHPRHRDDTREQRGCDREDQVVMIKCVVCVHGADPAFCKGASNKSARADRVVRVAANFGRAA